MHHRCQYNSLSYFEGRVYTAVEIWKLTQESLKYLFLLPGMQTINGHPPGTSVSLELFFVFKSIAVCLGGYTIFF